MRILGIHDGANSCAGLVDDGRVVAVMQEERLTGVKNYAGFPHRAIAEVLRMGGCGLSDVEFVALGSQHMPFPVSRDDLVEKFRRHTTPSGMMRRVARRTKINDWYREQRRRDRLVQLQRAGIDPQKVKYVDHHFAHAAAAYFASPWPNDRVLVLTCDGGGDDLSATVNIGEGGRLTRLAQIPDADSLGIIYAVVTFLLGMVPNEHEYKLMGLAPYAPAKASESVFAVLRDYLKMSPHNPLIWERGKGYPPALYAYGFLRRAFELKRFDWICGGLQMFTESLLTQWVRSCVRETGVPKVALSGGVGMNVKANKSIAELPEVESLFVFPSCTDESNAVGAAWYVYANELLARGEPVRVPPLGPLYWGPAFSDAECEAAFRAQANGFRVKECEDVEAETARLLARGEVVARFSGRMEFGARALGNRSILADPADFRVVRIINEMVKSRDFWMPFAPSVLEERGPRYVLNPKGLRYPYMILAFDSNGNADDFIGAIHPYDRTLRPQEVYASWNPEYHRLIGEFERLTGRAIILNTSLNLHGYPLVCSPDQALGVFLQSGLPHIALGRFLLSK